MTNPYSQTPQRYQIRIRGHFGESLRHGFPDLDAQCCGEDTILSGALPDQSALYGVLAKIESLALELIEVRRMPSGVPETSDRCLEGGTR